MSSASPSTSIVVVSGCPGSGKTTLSRSLAAAHPPGIHLLSDLFYSFPAEPIDPTRPESNHQNTVVMRALGRAASAFAEGGYYTVLDGVVGPWFLPTLREEISRDAEVSYVVLATDEGEAVRRVRERQGPGASGSVRHMVAAFADLGAFGDHIVPTTERSPDEVLAEVERDLARGRFRLG